MNVTRERDARSQLSSMSLRLRALRHVQVSRQRRELPSRSNVAMLELMYRVESPATDPGDRPRWTNRVGPSYEYAVFDPDDALKALYWRSHQSGPWYFH